MTYLIVRFGSVGNVAMTVPVIDSLSRRYPDHHFIVASKKELSAMFESMPNVTYYEVDNHLNWRGVIELWKALRHKVDAVIDLQAVLRTRVLGSLLFLSGKEVTRVRYGRLRKHLITLFGIGYKPLRTEFERYRDACWRAGLETDNNFVSLPVNKKAAEEIKEMFGRKTGKWIGIAPFAKKRSNMLPYRVMKQTISRLCKDKNTHLFLFGAGAIECEMLRQWSSVFPRTVSVAGNLTLAQELELMRHLDVMVCMDSANQHLASLVNLRAISVWCATHPVLGCMGWRQNPDDIIQRDDLACRPCSCHGVNHCKYGNYACRDIKSETLLKRIYE